MALNKLLHVHCKGKLVDHLLGLLPRIDLKGFSVVFVLSLQF